MSEPPKPEYVVVERDGRLVAEKVGQARPGRLAKVQLPKMPLLKFDWLETGQSLLARSHSYDLTAEGDALLTASQLENYIKLSARPFDLYFLSPRQQAIIGYLAQIHKNGVTLAMIAGAILLFFGQVFMWLFIPGAILAASLTTYFRDEYFAIHQQLYEPPTSDVAGANPPPPSAPMP